MSAFDAVSQLTGSAPDTSQDELRRQMARLLGSRGGKKGGPARAKKLTAKRRVEIARRAARARWKRKDNK